MPSKTIDQPMFGHHPYDPSVMDDDGLPYNLIEPDQLNDLPLQPVVYKDGYSADCPF